MWAMKRKNSNPTSNPNQITRTPGGQVGTETIEIKDRVLYLAITDVSKDLIFHLSHPKKNDLKQNCGRVGNSAFYI